MREFGGFILRATVVLLHRFPHFLGCPSSAQVSAPCRALQKQKRFIPTGKSPVANWRQLGTNQNNNENGQQSLYEKQTKTIVDG